MICSFSWLASSSSFCAFFELLVAPRRPPSPHVAIAEGAFAAGKGSVGYTSGGGVEGNPQFSLDDGGAGGRVALALQWPWQRAEGAFAGLFVFDAGGDRVEALRGAALETRAYGGQVGGQSPPGILVGSWQGGARFLPGGRRGCHGVRHRSGSGRRSGVSQPSLRRRSRERGLRERAGPSTGVAPVSPSRLAPPWRRLGSAP